MTLNDYLATTGENHERFAKRANVTIYCVRKWLSGERIPRPENIRRISKITSGAVTSKDWMGD
jgi:predicted transcriptional regulator